VSDPRPAQQAPSAPPSPTPAPPCCSSPTTSSTTTTRAFPVHRTTATRAATSSPARPSCPTLTSPSTARPSSSRAATLTLRPRAAPSASEAFSRTMACSSPFLETFSSRLFTPSLTRRRAARVLGSRRRLRDLWWILLGVDRWCCRSGTCWHDGSR
jgi:hypothetical protein